MAASRRESLGLGRFLIAAILLAATSPESHADGPPPRDPKAVTEKQWDAWWKDLEKGEAEATRALLKMGDRPDDAVAYLKERMRPLTIDAQRVKDTLRSLKSDDEDTWKTAFEELEYFDPRLAIDLQDLMFQVQEYPTRQRMVEVLSGGEADSLKGQKVELSGIDGGAYFNFVSQPGGSWWAEHKVSRLNSTPWGNLKKKWTRAVRAIVLLEHIGTPGAVAILKDMATGHPEAEPTRAAKDALERVAGPRPAEVGHH